MARPEFRQSLFKPPKTLPRVIDAARTQSSFLPLMDACCASGMPSLSPRVSRLASVTRCQCLSQGNLKNALVACDKPDLCVAPAPV